MPATAVRAGVAYVTEDRKVEGFFETTSIARNLYLGLPRSSRAVGRCSFEARIERGWNRLDRSA